MIGNTNLEIQDFTSDTEGRILTLNIKYNKQHFQVINIYGHNDPQKRNQFFTSLHEYSFDTPTILAGDFNMVEDPFLDRSPPTRNRVYSKGKDQLQNFTYIYNITDKWRERYPDQLVYTWFSLKNNENIASRLDRAYISDELNYHGTTLDTPTDYTTDHTPLILRFSLKAKIEKGPGFWKFNNSLLEDPEYIEYIEQILQVDQSKGHLPNW